MGKSSPMPDQAPRAAFGLPKRQLQRGGHRYRLDRQIRERPLPALGGAVDGTRILALLVLTPRSKAGARPAGRASAPSRVHWIRARCGAFCLNDVGGAGGRFMRPVWSPGSAVTAAASLTRLQA